MEQSSIGARIRQRRKDLGLTQIQIKQDTGISSGNMSDFENGNKLPSAPALVALSKTLNCSIDWLLTGKTFSSQNSLLTDKRTEHFLSAFQCLPVNDQEEIIEIIDLKLKRAQKKTTNQ